MDIVLQAERLDGRDKRRHRLPIDDLPDGAAIVMPGDEQQAAMLRAEQVVALDVEGLRRRPAGVRAASKSTC